MRDDTSGVHSMIGGDATALRAAAVCIGVSIAGSKSLITVGEIARISVSKSITTRWTPLSCITTSGHVETSCTCASRSECSLCAS